MGTQPESSRNKGCFPKGHVPWNKGKKGVPGYYPGRFRKGMPTGGEPFRFKKGSLPHNTVPIGTEKIDKWGYLLRKVHDRPGPHNIVKRWEFVHRLVWQAHYGEIPDGYTVGFKNGNRTDCRIENLHLVSKKDTLVRNRKGFTQKYPGLIEAKAMLGRLRTAITKKETEPCEILPS